MQKAGSKVFLIGNGCFYLGHYRGKFLKAQCLWIFISVGNGLNIATLKLSVFEFKTKLSYHYFVENHLGKVQPKC